MAEFRITQQAMPGAIMFNYDELKAEIEEKAKVYETMVYTADNMAEAKADKANLNKLKKALNDERIRREREFMEPFQDFKSKVNEIISIIDKPVGIIDKQVKEFEDAEKNKKKAEIDALWEEANKPDWLMLEQVWNEKWLNKSYSISKIREEMGNSLVKIVTDIGTLQKLPDFSFESIEVYKQTLDLSKSIEEGQRLADIQKRKEQAAVETEPASEEMDDNELFVPTWISFKAFLTVPQAKELRQFFLSHGIDFTMI